MNHAANSISDNEWKDIYTRLYAYAYKLLNTKRWFRGEKATVFIKGKEVEDYVLEAIKIYLEKPEDYNPNLGRSLVNYLKLHILRRLISNDSKSQENKLTKKITPLNIDDEYDEDRFVQSIYPYINAFFDEEIDSKAITAYIENEISKDKIVEQIYFGLCISGMKRREVISDYNIAEKDFNNGMRRLGTILKNTATTFGLNKTT